MRFKLIGLIFFLFYGGNTSLANDKAITVVENQFVYGGSKISKYSGSINSWDYESIISELDDFKPFKSNLNSEPPTNKIFWIYFELLNPDLVDVWINFGSARLNKIKIFRLDDNLTVLDTITSGFDIGHDYRALGSYKFSMPILSNAQTKGDFLVGYYSKSGLQETFMCFGTQNQIAAEAYYGNTYTLLFAGVFIILFCYNIVLFFSLKDKIYLFYSLNLVTTFLATTYAVNFPFVSVFFGEELTQTYSGAWIWILPFTMTLFTVQFFDLKNSSPKMYRVLIFILGLNFVNALGMFFLPIYMSSLLGMVLLVSFYAVCTVVGYNQLRKKHDLALLYFISWVTVFIGIILYFIVVQLGVFYSVLGHYSNYITASIEALLFSVALGKRYQIIMEKEKQTSLLLSKRNETLILANASLDSFNYHVSHDLKTIMVNSGSLNEMIKKYALIGKTEKVIQISDRLANVVKRGQDTIKGFLSLAEADKTKEAVKERINVKEAVTEIIESNGLEVIDIVFDSIEFDTISFNPIEFNSVFLNLLTNSKKYTLKSPKVFISLKVNNDHIQIIYSDNGVGVDLQKNGKSLFEPFERLDNDLNQEGTGVGLSLVKRIVNEYGGTIVPQSELNKGLTFIISLPKSLL
jgi:signal transduction histidine kinase